MKFAHGVSHALSSAFKALASVSNTVADNLSSEGIEESNINASVTTGDNISNDVIEESNLAVTTNTKTEDSGISIMDAAAGSLSADAACFTESKDKGSIMQGTIHEANTHKVSGICIMANVTPELALAKEGRKLKRK